MKFHEYQTFYALAKSRGITGNLDPREWSVREVEKFEVNEARKVEDDPLAWSLPARIKIEYCWHYYKRPYYSVFPLVAESLVKLPLDLDGSLIALPLDQILVRFPVGHELDVLGDSSRMVRSFLVANANTEHGAGLVFLVDFGDVGLGIPVQSVLSFGLTSGKTIEESLTKLNYQEQREGWSESIEAFKPIVKLTCTLCLLRNDPEIILPDVLDDDRRKYEEYPDQKYIERAHRRGKVGWLVGSTLTYDPHYRRPHFALRWTGEGRAMPKIVPIKGSVVHRKKLGEVPTGFLDEGNAGKETPETE